MMKAEHNETTNFHEELSIEDLIFIFIIPSIQNIFYGKN